MQLETSVTLVIVHHLRKRQLDIPTEQNRTKRNETFHCHNNCTTYSNPPCKTVFAAYLRWIEDDDEEDDGDGDNDEEDASTGELVLEEEDEDEEASSSASTEGVDQASVCCNEATIHCICVVSCTPWPFASLLLLPLLLSAQA